MNGFAMFRAYRGFGILAAAAMLFSAESAVAESYLTIDNVPVDVTAKNAAAAREQAIAVAQSKAFDQLIKQVVANPADQARLHPSQSQIESFVQDFGVDNERVSTVRYIGLYSVRFKESLVNRYLSDSGVTATNEQALQPSSPAAPSTPDGAPAQAPVTGPSTPYAVAVQVGSVADWVHLHNQLAAIPGMARVSLDAITHDNAAVTLNFAGDTTALQAALASGGYALVQNGPAGAAGPGGFQLQRAGVASAPGLPPSPQ